MREMAARIRQLSLSLSDTDRELFLQHAEDLEREAAELEQQIRKS